MAVKVDFKNDGLSLSRAKKPVGYYRNYKSLYFHSNEKLDALVEKLYTLRKELEECSRDEEESVINRIKSLQEDIAGEIFEIYEVEYGNDSNKYKAALILCCVFLLACLCIARVYVLKKERLNTDMSINNSDVSYHFEDSYEARRTTYSDKSDQFDIHELVENLEGSEDLLIVENEID